MNTDNNRRYQNTEDQIYRAYGRLAHQKPLDKITVSDICREAQIHRTTFYGHFQDILELSMFVQKKQFAIFWEGFIRNGDWNLRGGLRELLMFYAEHRELMQFHMKKTAGASFTQFLELNQNEVIDPKQYMSAFHLKSEAEAKYHQAFLASGTAAVIGKWVLSGYQESVDEVTEVLLRMLNLREQETVNNYCLESES